LDPFTVHLNGEFSPSLLESISAENPAVETCKFQWPNLGNQVIQMPIVKEETPSELQNKKPLLEEEKVKFA
jgi:hypothetical protein